MNSPYLHTITPDSVSPFYHTIFAAEVTSVPDLSSYEQFKEVDEVEQLRRVINRQRLLLVGLNVQPDSDQGLRTFELRYIWDGHIRLAYLGKGMARDPRAAEHLALELWADLSKLFPRDYYRSGLIPATDWTSFNKIYQPLPLHTAGMVKLRKQVEINQQLRTGDMYAVPHPYKWGIGSMANLCKTLMRQERPHLVSIALTPWVWRDEEIAALNTLTGQLRKAGEGRDKSRRMGSASTLAAGQRQVSSRDQAGQSRDAFLPDPQARLAAEIYEDYLKRLDHPLLFRPYIVADGSVDPSVVGALELEMFGYIPSPKDPEGEVALPHVPYEDWFSGVELDLARQDLFRMDVKGLQDKNNPMLQVNGNLGSACSVLARLPYLVDVQEASCAFRLPALPHRDEIGIQIHSGAFVTLAQADFPNPKISIGRRDDGDQQQVFLHDLTKHVLVVGTTGSGKTTTCLHILSELARCNVPFLVIEPVNAEHDDYRALLRLPGLSERLQVFTLGDEEVSPFRINPFEIQQGVTVNEHISAMLTAFKAAIPMWEPLPRLFLKALNRTFYRYGWSAFRKPQPNETTPFPNLRDFYRELSQVVDTEIEHEGEAKGNIRGASKLRIEALLEGSCGRILSAQTSLPIRTWMERPTLLELRHIGDDEDKALMIAFILMAVNEYLDKGRSRGEKGKLQHVILIEEAHRLLENTSNKGSSPEQANTKGQAAQAFAHALAENRKYGEGIIIAEQLPTKLVPDVIGNTALKIMQRLTSHEDREVMGKAMKFNEFQQEHVAALNTGQAAIYGLDLDEPILINAPNFWSDWEERGAPVSTQPVSDEELAQRMQSFRDRYADLFLPFVGCKLCPAKCQVRDHGEGLVFDKSLKLIDRFLAVCEQIDADLNPEQIMAQFVDFIRQAIEDHLPAKAISVSRDGLIYCLFLYLKESSGMFRDVEPLLWEKHFRRAMIPPAPQISTGYAWERSQ